MKIIVLLIITSAIQSLFGVGVLLFGTPILLLMGFQFIESLLILLPVSISINLLQISKDHKYIDYGFYKKTVLLSIPFVIIFLYFVAKININVSLIVGIFLIILALKNHSKYVSNFLGKLLSYNSLFFVITGCIHGMTNLGGTLLSAKVFSSNSDKLEKRSTIAISYMTFAVFQIITILSLNYKPNIKMIYYVLIGVSTYLVLNKLVFQKMSNSIYDKLFSYFLLLSGMALILKFFIW